jgi:hypothetical protein
MTSGQARRRTEPMPFTLLPRKPARPTEICIAIGAGRDAHVLADRYLVKVSRDASLAILRISANRRPKSSALYERS